MPRKRRRNAPWRPRLLGGAALVAVAACAVALRQRCDGAAHVVVKDGVRWLVQGGDVIGAAYLGHPDYAAFRGWAVQRVAALDEQVGNVVDGVRASRGWENTVLWFMGDNGPEPGTGASSWPLRGATRPGA